jgi:hypothetical protein
MNPDPFTGPSFLLALGALVLCGALVLPPTDRLAWLRSWLPAQRSLLAYGGPGAHGRLATA